MAPLVLQSVASVIPSPLAARSIPNMLPLANFRTWSPIHIDALGLVTLIGADSVNKTIGRLVQSQYTSFLPLLGAYLIASNQFTEASSGYTLFNLTDSIRTGSVAGWFTRWVDCQDLKNGTSAFKFEVLSRPRPSRWRRFIAPTIGIFVFAPLFALTLLMGDWWGVGNTAAMAASVLVRWYLVRENYSSLDKACQDACEKYTSQSEVVRILLTLANGKLATIFAPRGLVKQGFTRKPNIIHTKMTKLVIGIGWLAFGVHILALGQSALLSQIYSVVLLVASTWLTVQGWGDNDFEIGQTISVQKLEDYDFEIGQTLREMRGGHDFKIGQIISIGNLKDKRQIPDRFMWAFAKLLPNKTEEESLLEWGLLPRKANSLWWKEYQSAQDFCLGVIMQNQEEQTTPVLTKGSSFETISSSVKEH